MGVLNVMADGVEGRSVGDLRWNPSEKNEAAVNAIILSSEKKRVKTRSKQHCFQKPTVKTRFTRGNRGVHSRSESIIPRSSLHLSRSCTASNSSNATTARKASASACSNLRC